MKRAILWMLAGFLSLPSTWAQIPEINDAQLAEQIKTETRPMLLLYRYVGSQRLNQIPQQLEQLTQTFKEQTSKEMVVYSLSLRDNPKSAAQYGVRMAPTLIALSQEKVVGKLELMVEPDTVGIPSWFYCSLKINPEKNCASESALTSIDFLKTPQVIRQQSGLVLIELNANYCVPCRWLAPVMEEIARDRQNEIKFFSSRAHEKYADPSDLARQQEIMNQLHNATGAVPALVLFKDGNFVAIRVGYDQSEGRAGVEAWIDQNK